MVLKVFDKIYFYQLLLIFKRDQVEPALIAQKWILALKSQL
jgi:hypothetical protein